MTVDSPLSLKQYKAAVRDKLENYRHFFDERYSGRFIGPLFCITHHSYFEWNRRITGEMNHAIGFLKKTETGCRVHFVHTAGMLSPFHLFIFLLLSILVGLYEFRDVPLVTTDSIGILLLVGVVAFAFIALISAFCDSITENGIRGENSLYELMIDPTFGEGE